MIRVFRDSGFPVTSAPAPDGLERRVPGRARRRTRARRFEDRDRIAAVAAVARVLRPASVAVIGASRRPGLGRRRLLRQPASQRLPRRAARRQPERGLHRRPRGAPLDRGRARAVDLAIVAVPAAAVPGVARECGAAGVRGARGHHRRLRRGRAPRARRGRPSCSRSAARAGCGSSARTAWACQHRARRRAERDLRAARRARAAASGFVSQSGAFGIAAVAEAAAPRDRAVAFVSLGNKADLSSNDLLQYWEQDPATRGRRALPGVLRQPAQVRPHRAAGGAREAGPGGQGGRTAAGARAAASHTGALLAASDATVDALFATPA